MADVLEKRMFVQTPSESVILIGVDWPDPNMAFRLVDAAQQNYLESRHATEITAISEQVAILQSHATTLRTDIDSAVDAIEKLRAERLAEPAGTAAAPPAVSALPPTTTAAQWPRRPAEPDPELAQLKVSIEAKQRAINDLEEFRRRRLSELNASLAEKAPPTQQPSGDNRSESNDRIALDRVAASAGATHRRSAPAEGIRREERRSFSRVARGAGDQHRRIGQRATAASGLDHPHRAGACGRPRSGNDVRADTAPRCHGEVLEPAGTDRGRSDRLRHGGGPRSSTANSIVEPPLYPKGPSKPNAVLVVFAGLVGALCWRSSWPSRWR